jgi:hypothetical protein
MFTIDDYKKLCFAELKTAKTIPAEKIIPSTIPIMEKIFSNMMDDKKAMNIQLDFINRWLEYNPDASIQESRTCSALLVKPDDPDALYMTEIIIDGVD